MTTRTSTISHVTVIGSGTMGAQIGMVSALSGFRTSIVDIAQESLGRAEEMLRARMDRDVEKCRRTAGDVEAAFDRLEFSLERDSVVAQTDLVIEAAVEDIEVKRTLFRDLDAVAPEHTILTTNSSNIVSSRLADAVSRQGKVCNMHFFNPALIMECVEVVPHDHTDPETVDAVVQLAQLFGKQPVLLRKEVPGFVANRLLNALRREALELYESGIADFRDIDVAARTALRHPMGPFELMDMTGIDVVYMIRMAEYEQTGDPASLPAPSVTELYETKQLGRKTGKGWYDYT